MQVCRVLQGGAERGSGCGMASRQAKDVSGIAADCELGAYDHQLSLACPAGVPGCEGRGQFGFLGGGRKGERQ